MRLTSENLVYDWPNRDGKVPALLGLTAVFDSGIPHFLCGPSGSGKSTAGMLLAGLIEPLSGSIRFDGKEPSALSSQTAFVFQFPENIFFEDSVADELKDIAASHSVGAERYFASLGVSFEKVAAMHPYHLSAGYSRMVAIALQLAREPSLLILDEPTIGLDWKFHRCMCETLKAWCNPQRILIVITHDLLLMQALAGNTCVLSFGKQAWRGSTQEFLHSPPLLEQFGLLP